MRASWRPLRSAPARAGPALWLALLVAVASGIGSTAVEATTARDRLQRASSWGYQLQGLDAGVLARSAYDVLVVDFPNGDGSYGLGKREVARIGRKPDGSRRVVLAYINIGEAESYRYYWRKQWEKAPPPWMGRQNCRWQGDHRARHWAPEWQAIIMGSRGSYLGRIIDAGFDGAWLDRVDIHRYWQHERTTSFADMVAFVSQLSAWAKALRPGFLIVPQNGEELLADPAYRASIDGLGKEDLLFGDHGNDKPNAPDRIERALSHIRPAAAEGLKVLTVEYLRDPANRAAALARHRELGFLPYFGPRSLAYLGTDGPRHAEDGDSEPLMEEVGPGGC